ncbi:MAG: site-specific recombinase [Chitinophagales bacterium]
MFTIKKKSKTDFFESVTRKSIVIPVADKKQGLDFLISFFSALRPTHVNGKIDPEQNLRVAIRELLQHPILLRNLQHAILSQLTHADLVSALTESGIPLSRGFWEELYGRLKHKLLPALQNEDDFLFVINHVFFKKSDYRWVESIPYSLWIEFFESVGLSLHVDDLSVLKQIIQSLKILVFQVSQLGLEKEVAHYILPQDQANNPFVYLNYQVHEFEECLDLDESDEKIASLSENIMKTLEDCERCIDFIRGNHSQRGASLHQTYTLVMLSNKLDRINILVDILDKDAHFETEKFVEFFQLLVRNENRKNSIREFLSQCLGYVAYQIAEHKGVKGHKYITSTKQEYRSMMVSAMNGGVIISFVAIIKNLLTNIQMPIFWHGFFYSVNYSAGFVAIEETNSTLATKQPAFTASAVASSLDNKKETHQPNLYNLAATVSKVARSQTASFVGNLLVVFPGTYLLAWLYHLLFGSKIVEGKAAYDLLESQHPWHSLSLLYACNTGVFLFLSGIISGYVQNKIQYSHIGERVIRHPLLHSSISPQRLQRLSAYFEKHLGAIIGNIALGFLLGMAGLVPHIFGIPFDIRHITISAGNVAIAVYGLGFDQIRPMYGLTILLGVIGIGFINFLVSFSLAFVVAVKSRGVHIRDYPEFLGILGRYFMKRPLNFIRPPRTSLP